MSLSKHKSHNYATVQMVRWLSSVFPKLYETAHTGSNPVWTNFLFFFFSNFFFTASLYQLKVSTFLTMLGYYVELMIGLEGADKVHACTGHFTMPVGVVELAQFHDYKTSIGYNYFCKEPLCDQSNHTACSTVHRIILRTAQK